QVRCHRQCMVGIRGATTLAAVPAHDLVFLHQAANSLKSNVLTSTSQGHMNTRTAVAAETLGVQHADLTDQTLVGALTRRGRPATPLVIAAAGNLQQLAQHRYRILLSHRIDRGVLHCDSLTKNAVAFFRISFSIFSRAFSARSLLSSISNSLTGGATLPEELWGVPDPFKRSPRRAR